MTARPDRVFRLDDWLVESIKLFDPDDQRTIETIDEIFIHPVRDTVITADQKSDALRRVRELCDAANIPTTKTRGLLDDLEAGRAFYGVDGLLPAFYDTLEAPLDYVPASARVVMLDPTAVRRNTETEFERAELDRQAKVHSGAAAYPLDALYLDPHGLVVVDDKTAKDPGGWLPKHYRLQSAGYAWGVAQATGLTLPQVRRCVRRLSPGVPAEIIWHDSGTDYEGWSAHCAARMWRSSA